MELQTGGGQRGIGSKVPFAGEENADGIVVAASITTTAASCEPLLLRP